jgi:hypothetical protein
MFLISLSVKFSDTGDEHERTGLLPGHRKKFEDGRDWLEQSVILVLAPATETVARAT